MKVNIGLAATLAVLGLLVACSNDKSKDAPKASTTTTATTTATTPDLGGHILVSVTVDWEGAYLSEDGLDMLDALRRRLPEVPFTHFVSAGYFTTRSVATKTEPTSEPPAGESLQPATELKAQVKPGDELAIHVHAWGSLVRAAKVPVHFAPSFLSGKAKLLEFDGGDVGFDSDLDNYSVQELRAIIATSRRLLTAAGLVPSTSFRAGGYLGTPKVLEAARAEGLDVDASAIDHKQLEGTENAVHQARLKAVWPSVDSSTQPYAIKTPSGDILEVPIAAFMENASVAEILDLLQRANARLAKAPDADVFVVLGFHQETAQEFGPMLLDAVEKMRADPTLKTKVRFVTVQSAAKAFRVRQAPH